MLGYKNASANLLAASTSLSSDATLKSIVLSTATTLVYSTGPSNYNYTTSVDPTTTSLSVEPTPNDPNAIVTVNGVVVKNGNSSGQIPLNGIVTTTINLTSISQDLTDTLTYSIVVYESGSNDAFLSALSISTGNTLIPSTSSAGIYSYTTSVNPLVTSLNVTPTTVDPTATVTVNGIAVASGSASGSVPLNATGTTTINTVVTAQDGKTVLTYSIIVSKTGSNIATLSGLSLSTGTALISSTGSGNFSSGVLNYTTAIKFGTASLTVTPVATDANATITVNGTSVTSGHASGAITINPGAGAVTNITIVVKAQDGTLNTYSIVVSTNGTNVATLSSLTISTGTLLAGAGPNYTTGVASGTASVTVTPTATDPNSIITVGTSPSPTVVVASGAASGNLTLSANPTTIYISVKSQDASTTKNYSIAVSTNGSNNNSLSALTLSSGSTLVGTGPNYTTSISPGTLSITETPTAADPTATITVNGIAVTSGSASGPISINQTAGATTTITTVVTAQDNSTKTYTIGVSTNGSNNANLTSTVLSTGTALVPVTGSYSANYTTSVSPGTSSLTVTPTAADPSATITVQLGASGTPVAVASGVASGSLALNATGTTLIVIKVQSQDASSSKSYAITVSLNGSNNASLKTIAMSTGILGTPSTTGNITNYPGTVSPNTSSLTITPTAQDSHATITVNGLTVVSGNQSSVISLNATGTTTINILVTAENKTTTASYVITVSRTGSTIAWTGGSDGLWSNKTNWNPQQVPGAGDIATFGVSSYSGLQPSISSSISVAEMVFGANTPTTLTINLGSTANKLTVTTSLTINGSTATIQANKIVSGTQSYVDIAPGATINITGAGKLQLQTSYPVVFTLKSDASGSASIGQITATSISGTVNVERYIQGGSNVYRGYRLLSSPVYQSTASGNNIYSVNYVQATSLVTGQNGTTNGFDKTGNPSLYLFREDQPANNNSFTGGNYWGISDLTHSPTYYLNSSATPYNIPVANGFFFFYRGDRTNVANKYTSTTIAESSTMTATGYLNAGPITVHCWSNPTSSTLNYTTTVANGSNIGLNLVGNPYASSIDWDTYNTTSSSTGIYASNVGTSIYILDPVSKNYGVYIANSPFGGTNNATHIIPSGQGFFVQALATGASLTFNESAKTTTQVTGSNLLMGTPVASEVGQYLHLKLNKDDSQADEIFISFKSNAQSKYVFGEDAVQKPGFGAASLASLSNDGIPLSINTLSLPGKEESIALNVNATAGGSYQLTVPEVKSIPAIYAVWLVDAYKKDSVDVRQTPTYNFTIDKSNAASFGANRFSLVIRQSTVMALRLLDFTAAKATNGAQIIWKTANEQNYTNFTVERSTDNGKTFDALGGFVSSASGTYTYIDKNPLVALNQYRLKMEDLNGAVSYSKIAPLLYSNLSDNISKTAINVYPNPTSGIVNLAINQNGGSASSTNLSALQTLGFAPVLANDQSVSSKSYDIKIINITGNVVKTATSSQPSWQENLSSLLPGTYIIQVLNSSDKSLVGKSTFVKL